MFRVENLPSAHTLTFLPVDDFFLNFLLKSTPVSVKQNPWCVDLRKSSPPSDAEVHLNVSPLGARARRCTAARARSLAPELAHTDGTERVRNVQRRDRSPLCPRAVKLSPARLLDYVHEAALIWMQDKTHPPFNKLPPQARRASVCHPPL